MRARGHRVGREGRLYGQRLALEPPYAPRYDNEGVVINLHAREAALFSDRGRRPGAHLRTWDCGGSPS